MDTNSVLNILLQSSIDNMELQRRFIVVAFGFFGLLISIGYRTIFAMTMVQVLESNHGANSTKDIFGLSVNDCFAEYGHCRYLWRHFNMNYFILTSFFRKTLWMNILYYEMKCTTKHVQLCLPSVKNNFTIFD